jgi:alanine dehydrogenase
MKLGILRETKTPPDSRVPITPSQCRKLISRYEGLEMVVQPSGFRCFSNNEYIAEGIPLKEDLSDCDYLLGVKEVSVSELLENRSYLFFSHTAKEQPHNRKLLQAICEKGDTLIDYEYLTREDNTRVVAFGRWAGIVGAYNALRAYGQRYRIYDLTPAWRLSDLDEMKAKISDLHPGNIRIILTGGGRVAHGATEILKEAAMKEVTPEAFLKNSSGEPIFCRLDPWHYTSHRSGKDFEFSHFIEYPEEYENAFLPFAKIADIYIACHFWDPDSPVILSNEDLLQPDMRIRVIADISCDINGPIASTVRASTIADPVYGYDPRTRSESPEPFAGDVITVMAVDNLPGELPRNASEDFGEALSNSVIPALIDGDIDGIVKRATIVKDGHLTSEFKYLENYLKKDRNSGS